MATSFPSSVRASNRCFAKAALGFAKGVAAFPGARAMPLAGLGAICLATLAGAFGTGDMPCVVRTTFWTLLIGWNVAKWQLWFVARVRAPNDWGRAVMVGAVVLNLPLPLEITGALRLFGIAVPLGVVGTWLQALAISGTIGGVLFAARRAPKRSMTPAIAASDGLLARAGVLPETLLGVEAEDHYCRLHLANGRSMLQHYRFGDALAELAGIDGAQVHRGAWVAAHGVAASVREGRRWRLVLASGAQVPVSASHAPMARARGWLRRSSA